MAMQGNGLRLARHFKTSGLPNSAVAALAGRVDDEMLQEQSSGIRALRVLVADDNRDIVASMSLLVQLWGHDVRQAHDGVAALEVALAFAPDVLLLDIAMPLLDGCEVARQLRQRPSFQDALLVALTGYGDLGHRLLWEGAFDHYLIKPVDPVTVQHLLLGAQAKLAQPSSSELAS